VFKPQGANADFVSVKGKDVALRTYERGVEAETLACGTGAVAAALWASVHKGLRPPVRVKTAGDDLLRVDFTRDEERFTGVSLEGPVTTVYEGEVDL